MGAPEVTVVVPTRDRLDSLQAALAGICRQEDVLLEILVVDDGSMVDVAALVESLHDPRLSVVTLPESRGPAAARNVGISRARAPWVAFHDDDDLWAPAKLRCQLDAAAAAGARWVWCGAWHLQRNGRVLWVQPSPLPESVSEKLMSGSVIPAGASNVVVKTELLREVGGFDEEIFHLPDWDLWVRLSRADPGAAVDQPLVVYVHHPGMLSRRCSEALGSDLARVEAKLRAVGSVSTDRTVHRGLLEWIAESQIYDGHRARAAGTFARSALRHRSTVDAVQAAGAIAGMRGLGLVRRAVARLGPPAAIPPATGPEWLATYPEFPWDRS